MRIRQATRSDIPLLAALNRVVQDMHANALPERFRRDAPEDAVAQAFRTMIEAPSSYWLVAEDKEPIGFLSAEFREREASWCLVSHRVCYLAGIVIAPNHRRRGVARALLENLKTEAEARGVDDIELDVWSFNDAARQAFMKLGFRPLTERMRLAVKKVSD